ncbi:hypothetical protein MTO96_037315 [Rhipicephalus appendiculatus]
MKRTIRQACHARCSVGTCITLLLLILGVIPRASGATVPMRVVKQASGFDGAFAGARRTAAGYRYTLCPFDNVTQAEESARWNAYSGVLGVWQGWLAANGSLSGMHYGDGDSCGTLNRSVEVRLTCGHPRTSLTNVSEPERCRYAMELSTPLVCHPDALLVWPTLSDKQRQRWSLADSRLYSEETTPKVCQFPCSLLSSCFAGEALTGAHSYFTRYPISKS